MKSAALRRTWKARTLFNETTPTRQRWDLVLILILWMTLVAIGGAGAQSNHAWQIETVESGNGAQVGGFAALALDAAGNLHVAYYDYTNGALLYSYRTEGDKQWFTTQVDHKGAGTYVSLAVDANGQPHLAYNSPYEDGLHYATWNGQRWKRQIIDPEHINYYTSIGLDKEGHPRISYYLYHAPDRSYLLHLKFAMFDGNQWTIETVDKRPETGKFNSVAVDARGYPHIAYSHVSRGDLFYAAWDGTRWNVNDVDARRTHNDYVGTGNSIALDSNDDPHIAYLDTTKNLIKYAWREDGRWQTEVVDELAARGEVDHVSLRMDRWGRAHVAYYDGGVGALKYAVRDAKGWHSEVVDHDGNVGKYPSLCLDANDLPYIAYYALDDGALRIAHLETTRIAAIAKRK